MSVETYLKKINQTFMTSCGLQVVTYEVELERYEYWKGFVIKLLQDKLAQELFRESSNTAPAVKYSALIEKVFSDILPETVNEEYRQIVNNFDFQMEWFYTAGIDSQQATLTWTRGLHDSSWLQNADEPRRKMCGGGGGNNEGIETVDIDSLVGDLKSKSAAKCNRVIHDSSSDEQESEDEAKKSEEEIKSSDSTSDSSSESEEEVNKAAIAKAIPVAAPAEVAAKTAKLRSFDFDSSFKRKDMIIDKDKLCCCGCGNDASSSAHSCRGCK